MNRITIHSKVGSDGILQLSLPVGVDSADQDVQITVEPIASPAVSPDEWRQFILETAGKWLGEFKRPEQGDYEQRESLS